MRPYIQNSATPIHLQSSAKAVLVAVLVLGFFTAACQAQVTTKQLIGGYVTDLGANYKQIDDAILAFRNGNVDGCRQLLRAAKQKHPHLQPAEVLQARLFLSIGRIPEARDALERAVADDRTDPDPFLILADLAYRQRQFTFAELTYAHAESLVKGYDRNKLRKKDMQIRLYAGLSQISALRGMDDKAKEHLQSWIKLDPKNPLPHGRLAKVLFRQKKYSEARVEAAELTKLDKNSLRTEILVAQMYDEAGMRDWAKKNMEMAVREGPNDLRTRLAVGEWALSVGELDMAKQSSAAALKADSKSVAANILAGRLARQNRDLKSAESYLRKALDLSPSNFQARNQLVRALAVSDQGDKRRLALEYAQLNVRSHSDIKTRSAREAAITFAWLLFKEGREADAEKLIQSALRGGAISSESAYYVAKVMSQRGKEQAAIKILDPVLAMKRSFPQREAASQLLTQLSKTSDK